LNRPLIVLTAVLTIASGLHYVIVWGRRADVQRRRSP
jgi:hypothetical protein